MKFNELQTSRNKTSTRVGRGISAGRGKTAGRGTKGQNARAGSSKKPGFEGGQNPLMQRLPKLRGFRAVKPAPEVIYTGQLAEVGAKVDNFSVAEAGLVSSPYVRVKLVLNGNVAGKHTVSLQAASEGAAAAVQKAGGSFKKSPRVARSAQEKSEAKK